MTECRICLEIENEDDLITPCRCSGTTGTVHESCLQKWRQECRDNPEKYNKCELCREEYIIIRDDPLENFFLCRIYRPMCKYWFILVAIWTLSIFIGLCDAATDHASIKLLGLQNIEREVRQIVTGDPWERVAYYQSMGTFIFSCLVLLFTKLVPICYINQRQMYYRLMCTADFNFILGLLVYPSLILITHDLATVSLLCSIGNFTVFINIPLIVVYLKHHNQTLLVINKKYTKEKIMNMVYNPIPSDLAVSYERLEIA